MSIGKVVERIGISTEVLGGGVEVVFPFIVWIGVVFSFCVQPLEVQARGVTLVALGGESPFFLQLNESVLDGFLCLFVLNLAEIVHSVQPSLGPD